jgi:hypothetical protein
MVTDKDEREALREKAMTARRLAFEMNDALAAKSLLGYADSLDAQLAELSAEPAPEPPF